MGILVVLHVKMQQAPASLELDHIGANSTIAGPFLPGFTLPGQLQRGYKIRA